MEEGNEKTWQDLSTSQEVLKARLNISFTRPINALGEIDTISRRVWSKRHALSLSEGFVQTCPEHVEGKTSPKSVIRNP